MVMCSKIQSANEVNNTCCLPGISIPLGIFDIVLFLLRNLPGQNKIVNICFLFFYFADKTKMSRMKQYIH